MVGAVGKVIDGLTLPAREKRQLEADLLTLLAEYEKEMVRSRSAAVVEEARGNWLQRSWRPLVMLVFAFDCPRGDVHDTPHSFGHVSFLGFTGNRPGRVCYRTRRGKNGRGDF